ncbi:hypothetical protein [Geopsychrobacter electrodiphilus]|uniref:hypothetical protein n=1 Tax=Geopsychrobacter electrodiphilus TaxID=225196 RepID=UPI0003645C6F|nr:hypothetical protein [Geopsychrobacter electrodiphilus]
MRFIKSLLCVPLTLLLFTGCSLNVGTIRSIDATKVSPTDKGVVTGKVQFVVDGEVLKYNLFNRPLMRLFRVTNGQYYETPKVDSNGTFSWMLPEGDYEIAVLFGGMGPVGQPMFMRDRGKYWRVNGFTYPGYRLFAASGKIHYLGTLLVDVTSRKMNAVIDFTGERVFDSLNRMQIVDESAFDTKWQPLKDLPRASIRLFEPVTTQQKNTEQAL